MYIEKVYENSVAEEIGLLAGDNVLFNNGFSIVDSLDLAYLVECKKFDMVVERSGIQTRYKFKLYNDENLGISFKKEEMKIRQCINNCIFCFVQQTPPCSRKSLFERDDDYRFSFLEGNFITLTNLTDMDMKKICKYQLSPLYISVHTTDDSVRERMIRCKRKTNILKQLRLLEKSNIKMNIQIVLVPNYNNGKILDKTLNDLAKIKTINTIAIVPVGLTKYRENLTSLESLNETVAKETIESAKKVNQKYKRNLVFPADEIFVLAKEKTLTPDCYGNYSQYENGIGIVTKFFDEFEKAIITDFSVSELENYCIITGMLAKDLMQSVADRINKKIGRNAIRVKGIKNNHFGEKITVAGLVCGGDIINQYKLDVKDEILLIPDVMVRKGGNTFLDNVTLENIIQKLNVKIKIVENTGDSIINAIKIKE